jgi:hypothetical protein
MDFRDYLNKLEDIEVDHEPRVGDIVGIEIGDTLLETYVMDVTEDGVIVQVDETALRIMIDAKKQLNEGIGLEEGQMKAKMHDDAEELDLTQFLDKYAHSEEDKEWVTEFWKNINDDDGIEMEAKYQGREVPLGKPMAGDVKKSKVYVKGPKGNVVKVNFGDKNMRIKKSNPGRRKNFRARHNCDNPGPRWKARYWSCRAW